eukprot:CAMPEP_0183299990 /NCGR_PEP_ID=MMETSP0160_2-20130417/6561_1 /TAXON_ID=2839 ORGANISM="Odontella Sinensis, Strain Grunow 1884" /NCGR_SAMPLE_ID=MMETSP0160_2 /ASSEMBLY_ACC=CAM_ASM_000250 /LENGTH=82 /DNA_ID=CAMNT_0025462333 /DNA_START=128 /DNA_END=373 /DNA_ORIENTATION=-
MKRDEIMDRIAAMRRQEESPPYRCRDYLRGPPNNRGGAAVVVSVDATCRTRMIDWCRAVSDALDLSPETSHVASSYADRYLS